MNIDVMVTIILIVLVFLSGTLCLYLLSLIKKYREQVRLFKKPDLALNADKEYIKEGYLPLELFVNLQKLGFLEYDVVADRFNHLPKEMNVPDDFNWQQYLDRMHPEDRKKPEQFLIDAKANKVNEMKVCYRFMPHAGTEYEWFDTVFIVSWRDKEGNPLRILKLFWIITEEKKRELKLASYQDFYELTLSKLSVYMTLYMVESDKMLISHDADHDVPASFLLKEYADKVIYPDDRESFKKAFQDYIDDGYVEHKTFNLRFRTIRKGAGQFEWIDFTAAAVEATQSGKITRVAGIMQVISDKLAQEDKLRETKEMLEFSLKASDIVPWEILPHERICFSPSLKKVSPNATTSFDEYLQEYVLPEYHQEIYEHMRQIQNGEKEEVDIKIRVKIIFSNTIEWVHIVGRVINEKNISVKKIFGVLRIITKDVEREQELINLRLRAEENDRLKSAFLANMSHEIRTPLNAIVGFSQLLPFVETPEEAEEYNEIISANNELLLQLINDILDISNIETNQMSFKFEEADVSDIFRQLEKSYHSKMPANVKLICNIPQESYVINTERNRLSQVIINFLDNARKFTTEGSITIGYTIENDYIRLYVKDTGRGISEEGQRKVFERFVKLDVYAKGTGLGLSICHAIVKQFGGEIGVISELGKGSEFWFTIPVNFKFI